MSDFERPPNQSNFDTSSMTQTANTNHVSRLSSSSSPNFENSRSAAISANSTPENSQIHLQTSFSPEITNGANNESLVLSPDKNRDSKIGAKTDQIEELDLTKLGNTNNSPASLDLLQKVMIEKYFQSFASSLGDPSNSGAFLGGPNGYQNFVKQDSRQSQQLIQQMQNALLQIAAASANPGSMFQLASSSQSNFYLNTYNFLLQNVSHCRYGCRQFL